MGTPCEGEVYRTPRGVGYKIAGNAKFHRATVCPDSDSLVGPAIPVYTSDWSDLVCVAEKLLHQLCIYGWPHGIVEALEGVEYYLMFIPLTLLHLLSSLLKMLCLLEMTSVWAALSFHRVVERQLLFSAAESTQDENSACSHIYNAPGTCYKLQEG